MSRLSLLLLCLLLACSHVAATSVAGFRQLAITQNSLPHPKCVTKRVAPPPQTPTITSQ